MFGSTETAGGAAKRHESRCHSSPGHHRQDTTGRREAADVGEKHSQSFGQQRTRDTVTTGTERSSTNSFLMI